MTETREAPTPREVEIEVREAPEARPAWPHRQYERPAGRGPGDCCVVCDEDGWPCPSQRYLNGIVAAVRALIEKAGGLCVVPDDYDDDSINICETHSEILFGDTRTCEDDPAHLRAVLALLDPEPKP